MVAAFSSAASSRGGGFFHDWGSPRNSCTHAASVASAVVSGSAVLTWAPMAMSVAMLLRSLRDVLSLRSLPAAPWRSRRRPDVDQGAATARPSWPQRPYDMGPTLPLPHAPEAPEAQRVGDDEHRRERHGAGGDHRVEHAGHGQGDGGHVVGEGPEQV